MLESWSMKKLLATIFLIITLQSCATTTPSTNVSFSIQSNTQDYILFDIGNRYNTRDFRTNTQLIEAAKNHCSSFKKNAYYFFKRPNPIPFNINATQRELTAYYASKEFVDDVVFNGKRWLIIVTCGNSLEEAKLNRPSKNYKRRGSPYCLYEKDCHRGQWQATEYKRKLTDVEVAENKKKEKKEKEIAKIKEAEKAKEESKKPSKQVTKNPAVDPNLITIGSGSGFYINNKGHALTNNHVIDICAQSVAVIDGKETLFRVIATDKTNDVAVLKTDYKSRNYIKINEDGAKLGENVIAVGYPLAGRLSDSVKITRGIVSSLSGLDNNIGQIQIDAALQPGNSGGPVLNESGDLVGIASAGLNKLLLAKESKYIPENVNFAVASPIVVNILKSKKIKYTTPNMFSGSYSNTELAELGDKSTIQLFCRNTRTAYNKLKSSNKYSKILLDLD